VLVAWGLTNRPIAERLMISERTAEGHVDHIRNTLGVHTRAEIPVWRTPAWATMLARLARTRRSRVERFTQ
jgi:DNA-binding NarL/FixJ family response regulator